MREAVEERAGEPLGAEHGRPLVERQIARDQHAASLVALRGRPAAPEHRCELLLHDELLERGHDPLAVIYRQTDFARRKLAKLFLDPQSRALDFAIFVAFLDRHRPFHRRAS